jgi:glycosyltransferase involved in cell wall biosynthesis
LIFGQDQFLLSMASVCVNIAKLAGKPCYIRSIGGSLDNYYMGLRPLVRSLFRSTLRRVDGLIIETELHHRYFTQMIGNKVHYVPGYRPFTDTEQAPPALVHRTTGPLRTAFVGHIREEKGVFVLLESLRALAKANNAPILCDLFGPIYNVASQRFQQELAQTPNASYKGVLSPEQVIPTLRHYDAMVFPTHYPGEGHPGVIVEAMMAGIPVITTRFRSIPELIQNEVNGLLVAPKDAQQLGEAMQSLHRNRPLVATMGQRNWAMRTQFSATSQVPRILQPLGIQI